MKTKTRIWLTIQNGKAKIKKYKTLSSGRKMFRALFKESGISGYYDDSDKKKNVGPGVKVYVIIDKSFQLKLQMK